MAAGEFLPYILPLLWRHSTGRARPWRNPCRPSPPTTNAASGGPQRRTLIRPVLISPRPPAPYNTPITNHHCPANRSMITARRDSWWCSASARPETNWNLTTPEQYSNGVPQTRMAACYCCGTARPVAHDQPSRPLAPASPLRPPPARSRAAVIYARAPPANHATAAFRRAGRCFVRPAGRGDGWRLRRV